MADGVAAGENELYGLPIPTASPDITGVPNADSALTAALSGGPAPLPVASDLIGLSIEQPAKDTLGFAFRRPLAPTATGPRRPAAFSGPTAGAIGIGEYIPH